MKKYSVTTVCWPFDRLFPGNNFVFGDFDNEFDSPTKVCLGEIRLSKLMRSPGSERTLRLSVQESRFGPPTKDGSLSYTLDRAKRLGVRWTGGGETQAEVPLKPGEEALDGAMRIGREFFKLINLRTETPAHGYEELLPHFVVYEYTQIRSGKDEGPINSQEGLLRQKHRMGPSSLDPWKLDWLHSPWRLVFECKTMASHPDCCHFEDGVLKFDFPDMKERLVYCAPCRRHWFRPDDASREWVMLDDCTAQVMQLRFGVKVLNKSPVIPN